MLPEDLTFMSNFRTRKVEVNQVMPKRNEVEDTVVGNRNIRHIDHGSTRRSVNKTMLMLGPLVALNCKNQGSDAIELIFRACTSEYIVCQGKTLSGNPRAMYKFRSACTCLDLGFGGQEYCTIRAFRERYLDILADQLPAERGLLMDQAFSG